MNLKSKCSFKSIYFLFNCVILTKYFYYIAYIAISEHRFSQLKIIVPCIQLPFFGLHYYLENIDYFNNFLNKFSERTIHMQYV